MTDEKVFSGIHAVKSNTGNFHAVAVFLDVCNEFVNRYGLLLNEEPYDNLNEVLDDMERLCENDILSICQYEDLDQIDIYHPTRDQVGEVVKGKLVGFHIDYKRQPKKSKRSPVLLANVAVLINGEVHFVCADKMEIPIGNYDSESFSESIIVRTYMQDVWEKFIFGDEVSLDIVPLGRHRARYVLKEILPHPSFWEEVFDGVLCDL